jgi:phosphoglycolate phosphatase-like HAD superfamily hydrolase
MHSVLGIADFQGDWTGYKYVTDEGIVTEILARQFNRPPTPTEVSGLREKILQLLKCQAQTRQENFEPVPGALDAIGRLQKNRQCRLAVATGCWKESAVIKLSTAGFDAENLIIASADDSHRREEIMGAAYARALDRWREKKFETVTYVGDGVWDLIASEKMGYHFIGIGYYDQGAQLREKGAPFIMNDFQDQQLFFDKLDAIWGLQ